MLTFLIFLLAVAALVALAVLPLMYTARALGAERTGFWWVVLALVVQAAVSRAGSAFFGHDIAGFLFSFLVGSLVIKLCLVTSYPKALLISLISTLIALFVVLLLAGWAARKFLVREDTVMLVSEAFRYLA